MPAPTGYEVRFPRKGDLPSAYGSIAFKEKHWKVFEKNISVEARAQLTAAMRAWTQRGPRDLPKQRFRFEASYEWDGARVRLEAFKGWQVRFYGAVKQVDGKPMFLITGYDPSKKDDQADQKLLRASAKAAHALIHGG